jgi:hypothetical protein
MQHNIFNPIALLCGLCLSMSAIDLHAYDLLSKSDSAYGVSLLAGLESYPDSEHSSMSRGAGVSFIRNDLKYDQRLELDNDYLQMRFTYYYELDSEKYDIDRIRNSGDLKLHYTKPVAEFGNHNQYLVSLHSRYEGNYNSQQLEEFEQLALAGVRVDRRFSDINHYDLSFTAGVGYSEEEKDDDWPRNELGLGTDVLHRAGFGYLVELDNRYTFTHSGVQLALKVSHFDGRWYYDNHQFYTVDKLEFHVVAPLSNQLNLLHFTSQYIHRDYELELLGFKDTLFQVGVEYLHYF